jgi:hypothetical protein
MIQSVGRPIFTPHTFTPVTSPPPTPKEELLKGAAWDGEAQLNPLSRLSMGAGRLMLRLGTTGTALLCGAAAAIALSTVGAPVTMAGIIGGIGGYLMADAAKQNVTAFVAGPGTALWDKHTSTSGPAPPKGLTPASAGSNLLTCGSLLGGFAAGHAIFGPTAAGIITGFGLAFATAMTTGYAAGQAERALGK